MIALPRVARTHSVESMPSSRAAFSRSAENSSVTRTDRTTDFLRLPAFNFGDMRQSYQMARSSRKKKVAKSLANDRGLVYSCLHLGTQMRKSMANPDDMENVVAFAVATAGVLVALIFSAAVWAVLVAVAG